MPSRRPSSLRCARCGAAFAPPIPQTPESPAAPRSRRRRDHRATLGAPVFPVLGSFMDERARIRRRIASRFVIHPGDTLLPGPVRSARRDRCRSWRWSTRRARESRPRACSRPLVAPFMLRHPARTRHTPIKETRTPSSPTSPTKGRHEPPQRAHQPIPSRCLALFLSAISSICSGVVKSFQTSGSVYNDQSAAVSPRSRSRSPASLVGTS